MQARRKPRSAHPKCATGDLLHQFGLEAFAGVVREHLPYLDLDGMTLDLFEKAAAYTFTEQIDFSWLLAGNSGRDDVQMCRPETPEWQARATLLPPFGVRDGLDVSRAGRKGVARPCASRSASSPTSSPPPRPAASRWRRRT